MLIFEVSQCILKLKHDESALRITRRACPSGCPWLQATPRRSSSPATSATACEPPSGPVGDPPPQPGYTLPPPGWRITSVLRLGCDPDVEVSLKYLQLMVQNIMKEVHVKMQENVCS